MGFLLKNKKNLIFILAILIFIPVTGFASLPFINIPIPPGSGECPTGYWRIQDPDTTDFRCIYSGAGGASAYSRWIKTKIITPIPDGKGGSKCPLQNQHLMTIPAYSIFGCIDPETIKYIPDQFRTTPMKKALAQEIEKTQKKEDVIKPTEIGCPPQNPGENTKQYQQRIKALGCALEAYEVTYEIPCVEFAGGKCPAKGEKTSLVRYVARIYQFGLMIVGLAAFGAIVFGSIKYILAAGDIGSTQDAKEWITQAIWGLLLLLGAYIILYTINPQLVSLREPQREILSTEELSRQYQQELEAANQNQNIFEEEEKKEEETATKKAKPPRVPCKDFVRLNVGGNVNLPFIGNKSVKPLEHCNCPDGYEAEGGNSTYCKLIPE